MKKRAEWGQEHVRWLGEFLQIDVPAMNLAIDLISGNPYLIFATSEEYMPKDKSQVKTQILDDERATLLMGLLSCVRLHLRIVAGAWVRQFDLIDKGWRSIHSISKKLSMPSAFINVLRQSNPTSSLNGQYDDAEFRMGVFRFVMMMLKEPTS